MACTTSAAAVSQVNSLGRAQCQQQASTSFGAAVPIRAPLRERSSRSLGRQNGARITAVLPKSTPSTPLFAGRPQAVDKGSQVQAATAPVATKTKYYFVVSNAKFMLDDEQHLRELLRERLHHYQRHNIERDFWVLYDPAFLQDFPDLMKRVNGKGAVIVSTDKDCAVFYKLRLDRVLWGEFEGDANPKVALKAASPKADEFPNDAGWSSPNYSYPYPKYEGAWWEDFRVL